MPEFGAWDRDLQRLNEELSRALRDFIETQKQLDGMVREALTRESVPNWEYRVIDIRIASKRAFDRYDRALKAFQDHFNEKAPRKK